MRQRLLIRDYKVGGVVRELIWIRNRMKSMTNITPRGSRGIKFCLYI